MFDALRRKIEAIQSEPEAVRFRYLMICLAVSMLFIVGIWLITVKENFEALSGTAKDAGPLLPETDFDTRSLEDLMQGGLEAGAPRATSTSQPSSLSPTPSPQPQP